MNERILVVDDHPINLKLASDLLEMEGYVVDRAESAEEALMAVERQRPDLILLDVAMPGMDGLALTRALKGSDATRGISIVALTAFAMKGDEERAREAGCDGYIAKPIDIRKLSDQVAGYIRAAVRARRENPA